MDAIEIGKLAATAVGAVCAAWAAWQSHQKNAAQAALAASQSALETALANLRAEMAHDRLLDMVSRQKEKEEFRAWINGSFMRTSEVSARLDGVERRLTHLEQ